MKAAARRRCCVITELGCRVVGGWGSVVRPMREDGAACAELPRLRCILPAARLACSTSLPCSSIFNAQSPCSGKWSDGVISELHQTVLHVFKERTSKKEQLLPPWAQFCPPDCVFILPSNACRRACLSPFPCLLYNITHFTQLAHKLGVCCPLIPCLEPELQVIFLLCTDLSFAFWSSSFPNNGSGAEWEHGNGLPEDIYIYCYSLLNTEHEFQSIQYCCQVSISSTLTFTVHRAAICQRAANTRVQSCLPKLGFLCNWFLCYWTYKVKLYPLALVGTFPLAGCWVSLPRVSHSIRPGGPSSSTYILGPPISY